MSSAFIAIPAIDVREGRVVRLVQGDYARQSLYAQSPLATAIDYCSKGARWLHLVDLDAARLGGYSLQGLVAELQRDTGLRIQTGGGIRHERTVDQLLQAGVQRVVVGTLAVREPVNVAGWISRYGAERITLALDCREDGPGQWSLPVAGWTEASAQSLAQLLQFYVEAGARHLLCTDIGRDGMLSGFNLELYGWIAERWPTLALQASGGVRSLDDIRAARRVGAAAAILGRALLENNFALDEALAC